MSIWKIMKDAARDYIEKKVEEQRASQRNDLEKNFSDAFDQRMREKKLSLAFHSSIPEKEKSKIDQDLSQSTEDHIGKYGIPDMWRESENHEGVNIIDFASAKDRIENLEWKPTQVIRVADGIQSKITQVIDFDEDGDPSIYYLWEVMNINFHIEVQGTSTTFDQARENCDLGAAHVKNIRFPDE
jgi:hypothetical protein